MVLLKLKRFAQAHKNLFLQNVIKRSFYQQNLSTISTGIPMIPHNGTTLFTKKSIIEKQLRSLTTTSSLFGVNVRPHQIPSRLAAEQLVRDMSEEERKRVLNVLNDLEEELLLEKGLREPVPNMNQLLLRKLYRLFLLIYSGISLIRTCYKADSSIRRAVIILGTD